MFTKAQQRTLYEASSKLKAKDFNELPYSMKEEVMFRINKAMVDLHMQNPNAFLTVLKVSAKGEAKIVDDKDALKKRKFWVAPKSLDRSMYDSSEHNLPPVIGKVKE